MIHFFIDNNKLRLLLNCYSFCPSHCNASVRSDFQSSCTALFVTCHRYFFSWGGTIYFCFCYFNRPSFTRQCLLPLLLLLASSLTTPGIQCARFSLSRCFVFSCENIACSNSLLASSEWHSIAFSVKYFLFLFSSACVYFCYSACLLDHLTQGHWKSYNSFYDSFKCNFVLKMK